MSDSAAIAITTVFSILVLVDVVGNSLVCLIIKRNRDMRTTMNYLIVNLGVADILYATFIVPKVFFSLAVKHPEGLTGTVLCKLLTHGNIAWVGAVCSVVTLAVIAIERYFAVIYPLGNKGKLTKRNLKVIIPGIWIFSSILYIPKFLAKNFDKKSKSCVLVWPEEWMGKAAFLAWEIVAVLTMALMVVLYSKVVYTLWFKGNGDHQLTHQQIGVMRVRKRVTLMVVTVSVIFGICWGTDVVVYVITGVISYNIGPLPIIIANAMVLFNSAVNPFVYALLNQQFREKMKRMLCCTFCSAPRVHPTQEPQDIELASNTTNQPHTGGPSHE